jgi:hypothetical protein
MYSINVPLCLITFLLLAPMASADEVPQLVQPDAAISFERQIRPILKTWCLDCHGGESVEGKLDLRLRRFLLRGGESGPAAVPGDTAASLLVHRVRSGEMPQVKRSSHRPMLQSSNNGSPLAPPPCVPNLSRYRLVSASPKKSDPTGPSSRFVGRMFRNSQRNSECVPRLMLC